MFIVRLQLVKAVKSISERVQRQGFKVQAQSLLLDEGTSPAVAQAISTLGISGVSHIVRLFLKLIERHNVRSLTSLSPRFICAGIVGTCGLNLRYISRDIADKLRFLPLWQASRPSLN